MIVLLYWLARLLLQILIVNFFCLLVHCIKQFWWSMALCMDYFSIQITCLAKEHQFLDEHPIYKDICGIFHIWNILPESLWVYAIHGYFWAYFKARKKLCCLCESIPVSRELILFLGINILFLLHRNINYLLHCVTLWLVQDRVQCFMWPKLPLPNPYFSLFLSLFWKGSVYLTILAMIHSSF